jgi:di/tricarboxylate transporter
VRTHGVVVVGLWRREGWLGAELSQVELREGDLLVLWGRQQTLAELAENRAFLMLMPFNAAPRLRSKAQLALAVMAATIVCAATELLPAQIAFLAGALAMVLLRCVDVETAYKHVDVRIFVMIAGVIPLGTAMQKTGTAQLFADQLLFFAADWSPLAVLLAMFWAAALLTQILSDAATTVLLAPVGFAVATALGLPPAPFVVCTALGAVASFLTPIGHHGNLLILNPGQYTFADFLKIGVPLTVLIGLLSAWIARWMWLGGPLLPSF